MEIRIEVAVNANQARSLNKPENISFGKVLRSPNSNKYTLINISVDVKGIILKDVLIMYNSYSNV